MNSPVNHKAKNDSQTVRTIAIALGTCFTFGLFVACGNDTPVAPTRGTPGGTTARANRAGAGGAGGDGGAAGDPDASVVPFVGRTLMDQDFTESDRARDPFRSFAQEWVPRDPPMTNLPVCKLDRYNLDELKVVAVILGTGNPYAMVIDPSGNGTIVRRGECIGKPETQSGAAEGSRIPVPWVITRIVGSRIARDRENNLTEIAAELVVQRDDRMNPTAPRVERILSLAPAGEGRAALAPLEPQSTLPNLPGIPGMNGNAFMPALPPGASPMLPGGQRGQALPPGSRTTATQQQQGTTTIQSFTTIVPPTPVQQVQQPPPTTVVVQQQPVVQTIQPAPISNQPPPVQITGGGSSLGPGR